MLKRMIDGMGHRYYMATDNISNDVIEWKANESSMSMGALYKHIYQLCWWINSCFDFDNPYDKTLSTLSGYRAASLEKITALSHHLESISDEELVKVQIYLKRVDKSYPYWYLINGPISDIISHTGQILTWRRMQDNPVARISPFNGGSL